LWGVGERLEDALGRRRDLDFADYDILIGGNDGGCHEFSSMF